MKKTISIICGLLLITVFGCKKESSFAELNVDFDFYESGDGVINIIDKSTSVYFYEWDFGDLSRGSNDKNPIHGYFKTGEYTITLTANGLSGEQKTISKNVSITKVSSPSKVFFDGLVIENVSVKDNDNDGTGEGLDLWFNFYRYDMPGGAPLNVKNENLIYVDIGGEALPFCWSCRENIELEGLNDDYKIEVYEENFVDFSSEKVTHIWFKPMSTSGVYPTHIPFNDGGISGKVYLKWAL